MTGGTALPSGCDVDLTVVITAHSEGRLLRPTLRSIAVAIAAAAEHGTLCELQLILDNPTTDTVAEARRWLETGRLSVPVEILEVTHGDAGASRNTGAENARGRFVAFCDGDDLVSRNYFLEGVRTLEASSTRIIVHPETVVSFGARSAIWHIPATADVNHRSLIRDNLWPSSSISHRSTYLDFPYRSIPPEEGLGPEDWLWNIETSVAAISHQPVAGTMFFYRVREFGGVNNRHLHSILPPFDIEGLARAMPAQSPPGPVLVQRSRARRTLRAVYIVARPAIRVAAGLLGRGVKERLYFAAVRLYRGKLEVEIPRIVAPEVSALLKEAAEIDPAISWTAHGYDTVPEWHPNDDGYAELLIELVDALRPGSKAIVAVPWVGIGGADLVSLNYAKALAAIPRFEDSVTMLATYTPAKTIQHLIPHNIRFVQVSQRIRDLTPNQQRRIVAQALMMIKPELVISVNCFDITNSLQLYARQMASIRTYLTLFAFDRIGDGYPVNPITDDSQRSFLNEIDGIITDNSVTAGIVAEMLAIEAPAIRVHHQPATDEIPPFRIGTRAYNNRFLSAKNPFRIVWPHRLDKEKRPDTLIRIARRVRELDLPVEINVYGQQVLSGDGDSLMTKLADAGIHYRGPYTGGLASLPTEEFHALLLTSESEGLPLVLVQSMLLGLPVIASAVGGVTDIVRHDETGLLAAGPDDIDGFVRAIQQLLESLEDRRRLIDAAYSFAAAQHGWSAFQTLVNEL